MVLVATLSLLQHPDLSFSILKRLPLLLLLLLCRLWPSTPYM
jgi:hypothetical protein